MILVTEEKASLPVEAARPQQSITNLERFRLNHLILYSCMVHMCMCTCKLQATVHRNIPYLAPSRDAMHVSNTVLVGLPALV